MNLLTYSDEIYLIRVKIKDISYYQDNSSSYLSFESETNDDVDIPEKYAKTLSGMLLTTHTHVISFSIIFFLLGILFSMTSMIQGPWRMVLLIEPFASFLLTFLSIWGLRYVSTFFSMTTIFFGILTYVSFYLISSIILYELLIYKK